MTESEVRTLLESVSQGSTSIDDALLSLRKAPFEDIGFAKIDHHRGLRCGASEIIYGSGKNAAQIAAIVEAQQNNGERGTLITRLETDVAQSLVIDYHMALHYHAVSRVGIVGNCPSPDGIGKIVIVTGGTSDIPVAEEAHLTATMLGNEVVAINDVGVAGIQRLFASIDTLMTASVIIVIAGMDGALASVISGLVACPVIAVPTSIGYGASFGGLAALLSMLNSCAAGTSVVNIDNGFGAAYQASLINHVRENTACSE